MAPVAAKKAQCEIRLHTARHCQRGLPNRAGRARAAEAATRGRPGQHHPFGHPEGAGTALCLGRFPGARYSAPPGGASGDGAPGYPRLSLRQICPPQPFCRGGRRAHCRHPRRRTRPGVLARRLRAVPPRAAGAAAYSNGPGRRRRWLGDRRLPDLLHRADGWTVVASPGFDERRNTGATTGDAVAFPTGHFGYLARPLPPAGVGPAWGWKRPASLDNSRHGRNCPPGWRCAGPRRRVVPGWQADRIRPWLGLISDRGMETAGLFGQFPSRAELPAGLAMCWASPARGPGMAGGSYSPVARPYFGSTSTVRIAASYWTLGTK